MTSRVSLGPRSTDEHIHKFFKRCRQKTFEVSVASDSQNFHFFNVFSPVRVYSGIVLFIQAIYFVNVTLLNPVITINRRVFVVGI